MTTRSADSVSRSIPLGIPPADAIPAEVLETAARLGVAQHLQEVINLTREIYGGFSDVSISIDPEAGDTHIIFHAPVDCSIDEALAMDESWDRRILEIIPRSPQVYLAFAETANHRHEHPVPPCRPFPFPASGCIMTDSIKICP